MNKHYEKINELIQELPEGEKENVSDGYHTFKELYGHRVKLFIALCNTIFYFSSTDEFHSSKNRQHKKQRIWKSRLHSDGTMFDGWFIAGIGQDEGKTITYHLPIDEWNNLLSPEIYNAPEWDGHTSDDVLELLSKI